MMWAAARGEMGRPSSLAVSIHCKNLLPSSYARRLPSMASRRSLFILVWYPLPWRFSQARTSASTRIVTGFLMGR